MHNFFNCNKPIIWEDSCWTSIFFFHFSFDQHWENVCEWKTFHNVMFKLLTFSYLRAKILFSFQSQLISYIISFGKTFKEIMGKRLNFDFKVLSCHFNM